MLNPRNALNLARLVLVWFVLFLGVGIASPLVKPQSFSLVCSGAGPVKLVESSDDGDASAVSAPMLDCALCFAPSAPLSQVVQAPVAFDQVPLLAPKLEQSAPAFQAAAPPPARAPPNLI